MFTTKKDLQDRIARLEMQLENAQNNKEYWHQSYCQARDRMHEAERAKTNEHIAALQKNEDLWNENAILRDTIDRLQSENHTLRELFALKEQEQEQDHETDSEA